MPREGTKAARIMALYKKGMSTTQIAAKVGCRPEYVRVVARQRKGKGQSSIDCKWRHSEKGRCYTRLASMAYHAIPKEERKVIRRKSYVSARGEGLTPQAANSVATRELRRIGRHRLREAANA